MKNELQQLFSGLPAERRGNDGTIIEKPAFEDCVGANGQAFGAEFMCDRVNHGRCQCKNYREATEVMPVPDWMEFWSHLDTTEEYIDHIQMKFGDYNDIVSTILKLSDFIPCNENGEPMEEPNYNLAGLSHKESADVGMYIAKYEKACDRVVWWGWEYVKTKDDGTVIIRHITGFGLHYYNGKFKDYNTAINNKLPLYLEVKK